MKKLLMIVLVLLLVQVATAIEMCEAKVELNENCTMVTPVLQGCAVYDYDIINISDFSVVTTGNLVSMGNDVYQFNMTEEEGDYLVLLCDGSTREIKVRGKGDKTVLAILILLPLILGGFFLVGASTLGERHSVLKIVLFLLSPVTFWISMKYGMIVLIRYYNFPDLESALGTTVYLTGLTFIVILGYFMIYWLYVIIKNVKEAKQDRIMY